MSHSFDCAWSKLAVVIFGVANNHGWHVAIPLDAVAILSSDLLFAFNLEPRKA